MTIVIANIIDFIAALIQVGSGTIKQKTKILVVQIIQLLMQAVSMLLLGGVTGAVSNVLSCYRNYLCYKEQLNVFWKSEWARNFGHNTCSRLYHIHNFHGYKRYCKIQIPCNFIVCSLDVLPLCFKIICGSNIWCSNSINKRNYSLFNDKKKEIYRRMSTFYQSFWLFSVQKPNSGLCLL